MNIFLKWILNALMFLLVAQVVPGIVVSSFWTALLVALLWGLINVTLKPLLVLLTLPVTILTLGLFTLVINGFLFWFLARVAEGFSVSSFWAAFLGALVLSVLNWLIQWLFREREE